MERKKTVRSEIEYKKIWTWLRKGNLKRENTSQNNIIRINNVQAKIDNKQHYSQRREKKMKRLIT